LLNRGGGRATGEPRRAANKRLRHALVGDLEFACEGMELSGTPGWMLYASTTEPGSPPEERAALLRRLAVTGEVVDTADR